MEKYRLGEIIAEGGFGTVRECVKRGTNETLAVKIIEKTRLSSEEIMLLSIELEIICCIDHPNVVKTFEIIDTPSK